MSMTDERNKPTVKLILWDCIGLEVLLKPDDKIVMLAPKHPWAFEKREPLCNQHQVMYERYQKAGMGLYVAECMGVKDQLPQHYYWRKEPSTEHSTGLCIPCYQVTVENMEARARIEPKDPLEGLV